MSGEIIHKVTATYTEQPTLHELVELGDVAQAPGAARVSVYPRVGPDRGDPEHWEVELTW